MKPFLFKEGQIIQRVFKHKGAIKEVGEVGDLYVVVEDTKITSAAIKIRHQDKDKRGHAGREWWYTKASYFIPYENKVFSDEEYKEIFV